MSNTDSLYSPKPRSGVERNIILTQRILAALLVFVVVVPFLASWWIREQYPSIDEIDIKNLTMVGKTNLCVGDPIVWEYDFSAAGEGTLVRDRTLWSVTPPRTMIYSEREFFILPGAISQHLQETWYVPETYRNPATAKHEPIPPGTYKRLLSISSPTRSTMIAIDSVDFTIVECGE